MSKSNLEFAHVKFDFQTGPYRSEVNTNVQPLTVFSRKSAATNKHRLKKQKILISAAPE